MMNPDKQVGRKFSFDAGQREGHGQAAFVAEMQVAVATVCFHPKQIRVQEFAEIIFVTYVDAVARMTACRYVRRRF